MNDAQGRTSIAKVQDARRYDSLLMAGLEELEVAGKTFWDQGLKVEGLASLGLLIRIAHGGRFSVVIGLRSSSIVTAVAAAVHGSRCRPVCCEPRLLRFRRQCAHGPGPQHPYRLSENQS